GAERRDIRFVVQKLPEPIGADLRQCVHDPERAAQPQHIVRTIGRWISANRPVGADGTRSSNVSMVSLAAWSWRCCVFVRTLRLHAGRVNQPDVSPPVLPDSAELSLACADLRQLRRA